MKKLIAFILLISSMSIAFAKNKQQIFLTNNYGDGVAINLKWQNKQHGNLYQDVILEKNAQNLMVKAPISGHYLKSIDVAPARLVNGLVFKNNKYLFAGGVATTALGLGLMQANRMEFNEVGNTTVSWKTNDNLETGATYGFFGMTMILASVAIATMSSIGTAILKSINHHLLNINHESNYFVIEHTKHDSAKITIKEYRSQKHYEDEMAKNQN